MDILSAPLALLQRIDRTRRIRFGAAASTVRGLFMLMVAALLGGCVSYSMHNQAMERLLIDHGPAQALAALDKTNNFSSQKTLRELDRGVLTRMVGDLEGSNLALEQAKRVMTEVDAISLREQAAAITINDTLRSYLGAPFERILIHTYKTLNYLELNDYDSARVEALQLDVLMKSFDEDRELPIARYITGLVFESLNETGDALIAYRKAYQAYRANDQPVPSQLQQDLLRLTLAMDLAHEHEQLRQAFAQPEWQPPTPAAGEGELVFILHNGLIPRKHEQAITAQDPGTGQLHRIATPYYEKRNPDIHNARIKVADRTAEAELMARLDDHAEAALEAEMPKIIARAIARVAVKNKVVDNTRDSNNNNGALLAAVVNIAGVVTERADTRSWITLPQQILVARLNLPAAHYDFNVALQNSAGATRHVERYTKTIEPGRKTFVSLHWPASHSTRWRP